jgi:LemA protein
MNTMSLSLLFFIIIGLTIILLIYTIIYNNFQHYIIKINKVENNIDNTLRTKFDILIKIYNIIKEEIKDNEIPTNELNNLKKEKLSSFQMDRKLISFKQTLYRLKNNESKTSNDNLNKLCQELDELDQSLEAYCNYYNDNISNYNKLVKIFPTNIVSKISKLKEKPFYDGKDLTDENINDFKL